MNGYRVLIVEDRPDHLRQISTTVKISLDQPILRLDTAATRDEAIELLNRVYYHIALVDLRLKDGLDNWDGFDVAKQVFQFNERMNLGTQVVILTAYGELPEAKRAFRQYKVLNFIQKEAAGAVDELISAIKEGAQLASAHNRRLLVRLPRRLELMKIAGIDLNAMALKGVSPEDLEVVLARVLYKLDPLLVSKEQSRIVSVAGQMPMIETRFWSKALGRAVLLRLGGQDEIEADVRTLDNDPALLQSRRYESKVEEMFVRGLGAVTYVLADDLFDQFEVPVF